MDIFGLESKTSKSVYCLGLSSGQGHNATLANLLVSLWHERCISEIDEKLQLEKNAERIAMLNALVSQST